MSDIIQLLPDSVANQIAAGEVIQRPASVIKELVENAIDAGATAIDIYLKDAGRTLIQVIDNGQGMTSTDARMAFERHATSKIRKADDLFALTTMGFRGEALASIAAISQVELITRPVGQEMGTRLCLSGCQVESQESILCSIGSNFSIKNIFFNVPARRKFLKSNQTELSNILAEFERIALVNPQVAFNVTHNGALIHVLSASGLRQRITQLLGRGLNNQLLPIEVMTSLVKINGFICQPEHSRKRNALQYLFVNNRYMRHPYFHKAVMHCYEPLIPHGEMPNYFLYFEVDPSSIDVNIHPTKTEIKFENEQPIWQIITAAVRESLGKFSAVPSIDFDMEGAPNIPIKRDEMEVKAPSVSFDRSYNPFKKHTESSLGNAVDYADLRTGFITEKNISQEKTPFGEDVHSFLQSKVEQQEVLPLEMNKSLLKESVSNFFQYKGSYIVTSVKSGLMVIDQHRAHLRILYDQFLSAIEKGQGASHRLLFPQLVELTPSDVALLEELLPQLQALGFELSALGNGSYAINGVPAETEKGDITQSIHHILAAAKQKGTSAKQEQSHKPALALARSAALGYDRPLTVEEMEYLYDTLFACQMPQLTPDGKTVLSIFNHDEILKQFK